MVNRLNGIDSQHLLVVSHRLNRDLCIKDLPVNYLALDADPRLKVYTHNLPLRSITVFYLFLDRILKSEQLGDNVPIPTWYFGFASKVSKEFTNKNLKINTDYFTELAQKLSHPGIIEPFRPLFSHSKAIQMSLQEVINPENQENVELTQRVILANLRDLFDHLSLVFPTIKTKFVENKPPKPEILVNYQEGLKQLEGIETFLKQFHKFCYKRTTPETIGSNLSKMRDEIDLLYKPLFESYNNNTALFFQFQEKFIHFCATKMDVKKLKNLVSETVKVVDVPQEIRSEYIKHVFAPKSNYQDLFHLLVYMDTAYDLRNTMEIVFFVPFVNLVSSFTKLTADLKTPRELNRLWQEDRPPRFGNPTNAATLQAILEPLNLGENAPLPIHHPRPKRRSRELEEGVKPISPLSEVSNTTPPFEETPITSPIEKNERPFESVRKRFPTLLDARAPFTAVMYLEDLEGATRLNSSRVQRLATCNGAHRLIQQLMQNHIEEKTGTQVLDHHLKRLQNQINLPLQTPSKISAAHLWIDQTYESLQWWKEERRDPSSILVEIESLFREDPVVFPKDSLLEEVYEDVKVLTPEVTLSALNPPPVALKMSITSHPLKVNLEDLLEQVDSQSSIYRLLKEFQKDLKYLGDLEKELQTADTSNLPLLTRQIAKIHHALLQHLLQAIYSSVNFSELKEHDLNKLVDQILWINPLPQVLKDRMSILLKNLHHLASYPFDAKKRLSPWHDAILMAEVIRASSDLLSGFQLAQPILKFGELEFDTRNTSLDPIIKVMTESKKLLSETIPLLIKELSEQIG